MKCCYFYIKASDNPPNIQEIKMTLVEGSPEEKIQAIKELIKCLVNDDTYPPLIMHIISNITPLLGKFPELRKVMLLYWQVIEKSKSVNDHSLKDEMFLACNSLRSDLLSHNEYLRGRTLRLVSRIMHKGVIDPLSSAIVENIKHKSAYVRRNTIVCLYNVFSNFQSDIIGDIDEEVEELLQTQTDLSTKRNAFILLNKSNPQKAMQYLYSQIKNQSVQEIGDILQLAILKVLKQKAKQEQGQKGKYLKIINDFSMRASQSVLLQCSITSLAISNSVMSIKNSLSSYVNILSKTNELNVKKIILDKLEIICRNSNYIEQPLLQDLIKILKTPSSEIKCKIMDIISSGMSFKISELVLRQIKKEITEVQEPEYIFKMIKTLQYISSKFPGNHAQLLNLISQRLFRINIFNSQCSKLIGNSLRYILNSQKRIKEFKVIIIENFQFIQSKQVIKQVLNVIGEFYNTPQEVEIAINGLQIAIGSLPIEACYSNHEKQSEEKNYKQKEIKTVFRTIILEDGTYSTQMVHQQNEEVQQINTQSNFRNIIAEDSIVGGIFTRNTGKMLYKIRNNERFNKNACSILMILCSLLRNYEENISEVDQSTLDQISTLIRKVINTENFRTKKDETYENKTLILDNIENVDIKKSDVVEKNPEDLIFFRQLKRGNQSLEQEFEDQEVNQIIDQKLQKQDFVSKLASMVQLTGYFDPLYAESFVTVNKYDILFQILLINNTKSNLLNVQCQFSSTTEIIILQKAQSVNLRPLECVNLRTQIRFTGGQLGSIFGYINYDNQAGLQQPYLITEQIKIDYMQFIQSAKISESEFKNKWNRAEEQQVYEVNILTEKYMKFKEIIIRIQKQLHCLRVEDNVQEEFFTNIKLYGKSKLGQDFMINLTLYKDKTIQMTLKIRSKDKAVLTLIMKKLKDLTFQNDQNDV